MGQHNTRTLIDISEYLCGRDENNVLRIPESAMSRYMHNMGVDYKTVEWEELRHKFFLYLRKSNKSNSEPVDDDGLSLSDKLTVEKTKLAASQAKESELRVMIKAGQLVPITALELTLGKIGSSASSHLASIPLNLKRRIPHLTITDIELITKELITVQNAISDIRVSEDDIKEAIELDKL